MTMDQNMRPMFQENPTSLCVQRRMICPCDWTEECNATRWSRPVVSHPGCNAQNLIDPGTRRHHHDLAFHPPIAELAANIQYKLYHLIRCLWALPRRCYAVFIWTQSESILFTVFIGLIPNHQIIIGHKKENRK